VPPRSLEASLPREVSKRNQDMPDNKSRHRHVVPRHAAALSTTRQCSRRETGHRVRASQARPTWWALVQVWDGSAVAFFADEAGAREAMSRAGEDEIVVLYVKA
jgi:hypothetical protein